MTTVKVPLSATVELAGVTCRLGVGATSDVHDVSTHATYRPKDSSRVLVNP